MFKKLSIFTAIFTAVFLMSINSMAQAPVKKITEMLYPTVLVDLGQARGSGTIIFSSVGPTNLGRKKGFGRWF